MTIRERARELAVEALDAYRSQNECVDPTSFVLGYLGAHAADLEDMLDEAYGDLLPEIRERFKMAIAPKGKAPNYPKDASNEP